MSLKLGRRLAPHEGSFGQAQGSRWAKFAGVLNDSNFLSGAQEGRKQVRLAAGKARMATSLARTKAGYKHKGGNTAQREQDEAFKVETDQLRKTVEAQNEKILELEGKITPEEPMPEEPSPIGNMDETNII